jgi:aryl-alcohol dehydrogenase-like predicted oxidoreductase
MKEKKDRQTHSKGLSRRGFIGGSIAALAGFGLKGKDKLFAGSTSLRGEDELKIKEYRTLGRTGFKCSDIGFGSSGVTDPALIGAILDSGVNYIDSAESYSRGRVESALGNVIKNRDRKSVFISTKMGLGRERTKEAYKNRALKCLERLQSDYIDCLMIHMPSTVEQLKTEGFHAAFKELKAEGKVKYCGLSNHGPQWGDVPETMEQVHLAAAEDGRFDVALLVYNFVQQDMGRRILKVYKEKNIGATLMKTNPVLNYMERKVMADQAIEAGREVNQRTKDLLERLKARADQAESFKKEYNLTDYNKLRNAAIKFVLSNPNVNSVCPTILNFDDLETYVGLSGARFEADDKKTLALYKATFGEFYCRHACGECESHCPAGVPVNTIMRYNHYFVAQKREKHAMEKYAHLPTSRADMCGNCSGHCQKVCPHNVPVQGMLILAHQTLTLA